MLRLSWPQWTSNSGEIWGPSATAVVCLATRTALLMLLQPVLGSPRCLEGFKDHCIIFALLFIYITIVYSWYWLIYVDMLWNVSGLFSASSPSLHEGASSTIQKRPLLKARLTEFSSLLFLFDQRIQPPKPMCLLKLLAFTWHEVARQLRVVDFP